jgi:hypothetical protein
MSRFVYAQRVKVVRLESFAYVAVGVGAGAGVGGVVGVVSAPSAGVAASALAARNVSAIRRIESITYSFDHRSAVL